MGRGGVVFPWVELCCEGVEWVGVGAEEGDVEDCEVLDV